MTITQKPYISKTGRDWTVLDSKGQTAFTTRDSKVAETWFALNFYSL